MEDRQPVEILSGDDDSDPSPYPAQIVGKKQKIAKDAAAPFLILDDDDDDDDGGLDRLQSPPSVVPETPFFNPSGTCSSFVKGSAVVYDLGDSEDPSGEGGFICLESDSDGEDSQGCESLNGDNAGSYRFGSKKVSEKSRLKSGIIHDDGGDKTEELQFTKTDERFLEEKSFFGHKKPGGSSTCSGTDLGDKFCFSETEHQSFIQVIRESPSDGSESFELSQFIRESSSHGSQSFELSQAHDEHAKVDGISGHVSEVIKRKNRKISANAEKKKSSSDQMANKLQLKEERKRQKEQEKLQREALKAEAAKQKKLQKEQERWEKGKFALKSIVAEIDTKVVETGSIGGHLLTRLAEKGLTYRITTNDIGRSVKWKMNVPDQISELSSTGPEVPYILLVYAAEEFCDLVSSGSLIDQIVAVQSRYPSYTVCCLTNKLMAYINKREQSQYKGPSNSNGWKRPPVEEVLANLTSQFVRVHSRQCIDEAEVADHIVGLTCSLATCQFRKNLTWLSVYANGSFIPKNFADKNLIKKSAWLKALISIPKVQPRFAVAIWKKYPTMRSLLNVYMDPSKSVHEKEFLLKDLVTDGQLVQEERRVGEICSKRVYRILMAESGNLITDDIEDGADFFNS